MHVLVVFDHPDPKSLSHALAARFIAGAEASGHTTELADLNGEGFDPRWTMADVDHGEGGPVPPDVRAEQVRVERAEAICLVFPLFWYGMPATMKGWIDRVWSWGWGYDQLDDPEKSLQPKRPGVLLIPAGASSDEMDQTGQTAAIQTLWDRSTFGFFGFSPRRTHLLNGSTGSEPRRLRLLEQAEQAGRDIGTMS